MKVSSWQNNSYNWGIFHCQVWLEGNPNMLIPSSISHAPICGSNMVSPMIDACVPFIFDVFLAQCSVQKTVYSETDSSCWSFHKKCCDPPYPQKPEISGPLIPSTIPTSCGDFSWNLQLDLDSAGNWDFDNLQFAWHFLCIYMYSIYINTRSIIAYSICF